ncbi:MAG: arsenical pump-driving ATPase [Trueperaceae bacterium]|nr:arsenical pump-driving ATPase [Trueperaceae bacterium]
MPRREGGSQTTFPDLAPFSFFTGKGGVGKTSLACATAVSLADEGRRVLLVSTDPASNVAQVLETPVGPRITPIEAVPGLDAIEIDPASAAADYRERIVGPLRDAMPAKALAGIEEQLSGACTTEIAAFDEFTTLLTDDALRAEYDHIVFDTAPTGHTIRLLQLSGAWSSFLENGSGDASCLGPLAGLEKQRARYAAAVERLADPDRTQLILVARPQRSSLDELARTSRELAAIGLNNQRLAINGRLSGEPHGDRLAMALQRREAEALASMDPALAALPRREFPLRADELMGVAALRRYAANAPAPALGHAPSPQDEAWPALSELIDDLEAPGAGLVMFLGKGGVGKTTMAAAVATELARRGHEVLLTTTDPAAHLASTLGDGMSSLEVDRIDPAEATERYRQHVLQTKGQGLGPDARAALEEDLRSPCTEEIAVFQAFAKAVRDSARRFVVMDTAPTGHTLLLLDAAGSYHREVLRHATDTMRERMTTPMMRLQDPARTKLLITTLPETTPMLEAADLQDDLRRAGIEPWAWIVNASLSAADTGHPVLRRRADAERDKIRRLTRDGWASRYAVVPMLADEPVGTSGLRGVLAPAVPASAG